MVPAVVGSRAGLREGPWYLQWWARSGLIQQHFGHL